jgi:hypothetical protein
MLQKKIESTFSDPHGGNAETEKHRIEAANLLGDNPIQLSSSTCGVLNEAGTETIGYKLTTLWQQRGPA